jgi:hypothetical protein
MYHHISISMIHAWRNLLLIPFQIDFIHKKAAMYYNSNQLLCRGWKQLNCRPCLGLGVLEA